MFLSHLPQRSLLLMHSSSFAAVHSVRAISFCRAAINSRAPTQRLHISSFPQRYLHLSATRYTTSSSTSSSSSYDLNSAKSWNLVARLASSTEDIESLSKWLSTFKRSDIPSRTFVISHARSSGAGGQNVNKVNTKVDLRFVLDRATWLPTLARSCLREQEKARINSAGELVVTSERTRTQGENFEDCVDKLYEMITKACAVPKQTDAAKVQKIKKLSV